MVASSKYEPVKLTEDADVDRDGERALTLRNDDANDDDDNTAKVTDANPNSLGFNVQTHPPWNHNIHGAFLGTFRFVGLYKKVLYTTV